MRGFHDFGLVSVIHDTPALVSAHAKELLSSETFIVIPASACGTWMLCSMSSTRHKYVVQGEGCVFRHFQVFGGETYEIVVEFTIDFAQPKGFVSLDIEDLDSTARIQWSEGSESLVISDFAGYRLTLTEPMVELPIPREVMGMDAILKRLGRV